MFDKILIANRGEIACRIMRTCKRLGVQTVAVYSQADRGALFTRLADEAYEIGPAPARDSYLRGDVLLDVARATGAAAIHPGYGFLAENAQFSRDCQSAGVRFIGPSPHAIEAMGLKHAAKALMERARVQVVPGYHGDDQSDTRLLHEAERIGFPVLIKAVAGGGGKGMRRVEDAAEFSAQLSAARREAESSFGDARVLVEKYVARPRHIEVQVLADAHGRTLYLHERDCSLQRRHQKVVEEAPAPQVSPALRKAMGEAAVRAAEAVQYEGAGTVEFIVDASAELTAERFYFMEMNTRLQVEHPVTELITGLDLVEWQLRIASGEKLPFSQLEIPLRGHAIEVRVCAENPAQDYAPRTGQLLHVRWPEATPHMRIESGIESGDVVTPFYDSMLSKLVVWGEDRAAAVRQMGRCLSQVELAGVEHNVGFLRAAVTHPAFAAAELHTGFLPERHEELVAASAPPFARRVLLAAMALLCNREPHALRSPWDDTRAFRINAPRTDLLRLSVDGTRTEVAVEFERDRTLLTVDGQRVQVERASLQSGDLTVLTAEQLYKARYLTFPSVSFLFLDGHAVEVHVVGAAASVDEDRAQLGAIESPLPGRILSVFVKLGQAVQKGDPLVSMEAMKMEHTLRASVAGVVSELSVEAQEQVIEGSTLLVLSESSPPKE